jgi:D-sedoheptulose 7-phosphate isomerase
MQKKIFQAVNDAILATQKLKEPVAIAFIQKTAQMISDSMKEGNKLLIAGNGGSLCDAMHFSEELTGYYREKRKALPAIALCEPGHLTCVGNDTHFDDVFQRAVEALGKEGDVLVVLTTSGNSQNLVNAVNEAKNKKIKTIAFLGKTGGKLKGHCDLEWVVDGFKTSDRIQEAHMTAIHIIIEMIESLLIYDCIENVHQEVVL